MDIKSLKDKILQLAIQGKLVPQNENDEPASVLLEKIRKEKEQLIKDKVIKKEKLLQEISEEEMLFQLPKKWKWCRLGDISIKITDGSHNPPKGEHTKTDYIMLSSQNINQGTIVNLDKSRYLSEDNYNIENKRTQINRGDILLTIVGTIGRSCIYNESLKITLQRSVAVIDTKYCNIYLKYLFDSPKIQAYFNENASGTAQKGIYLNQLRQTVIPLPPLEEQERIVLKIEELFKLIDELDNNKQDLLENIANTRNKVLQLAIQGKLVEQCEDDEPASILLEKIREEKEQLIKDKVIKKEKPLPEISEEEKVFELPKGWEWCRLANISNIKGGKRIPAGKKLLDEPTEHMYIRVADMKNGTIIEDDIKYISDDIYEQIKNYYIEKDDIYMTIAGTIGRVGTIPDKFHMANLTENASKIRVYKVDKDFIFRILNSQYIQIQISNKTKKVGQPKLALNQIESLLIPLPPLEEQKRIVAKVDLIMDYLDKLQQEIDSQEIILEDILQ